MLKKIMQIILVAIFLIATVHSYSYHTNEIVNANDDNKNISDKIDIVLEADVNLNSDAANSRKRFITYVNDGLNNIFAESLGICQNLFGATIEDVAILNGTDTEVTNKVIELTAFIDRAEKLEKEKSSVVAKFQLIMQLAELLKKYDLYYLRFEFRSKKPTVADVLFYISMQKNGLDISPSQIGKQIGDFIENFKPIAAEWYSYAKSLSAQDVGFNLWYRIHSRQHSKFVFFSFGDLLKLYSEFN